MVRRKFIAGNWKMNSTRAEAVALASAVAAKVGASSAVDVAVCPPSPYLEAVDPDRTRRGLEHVPRPGGLIELATSHLDGRVCGRALQRRTDERRDGGRQTIIVDRDRLGPCDLPIGVQSRGLDAQAHRGLVRLGQVAEEAEEPGGPADAHD